MQQTFAQRFAVNLEAQLKSGSTWVAIVLVGFLGLLASWPDLATTLDAIPLLHGYGTAIAGLIVLLATKLKPSNALTSQSQALAVELARTRMNDWLRSHGAPEIPPDPSIASKLPPLPLMTLPAPHIEPSVVSDSPKVSVKRVSPPPPEDPMLSEFRRSVLKVQPNATNEMVLQLWTALKAQ